MNDNTSVLSCRGLYKSYGSKQVLADINLEVPPGRIVGLLGPNGSGKTTLIKTASGLLSPNQGEIRVAGLPVGTSTKGLVSYLPERSYLSNWMKVRDIMQIFQDFYPDFNLSKAHDMLQRLQIRPEDPLKTMSKGTKEKVQLILVMSREARLYLLDEPIGGVDPAARDYILRTIITNYSSNSTILISTHLITDIEQVLDDVIFLSQGRIALVSSVDQIREEKGTSVDALFREVYRC